MMTTNSPPVTCAIQLQIRKVTKVIWLVWPVTIMVNTSQTFLPLLPPAIYIPPSLNILQNCKTCIHVHNGYWVKAKLNIHICYMLYHICFIFGRQYIAFYSVVILDLGLRSMWWMLTFLMKSEIGPFFRVQNF